MPFWIESDPLIGNFLQNHRTFDILHLKPPYEHVNKVDEGELDQSAEHLNSRFYIVFFFFPFFIFFLYQSLLDHERETHRDKAENDEDVHCRCISDLQQKVRKTIATVREAIMQEKCSFFNIVQTGGGYSHVKKLCCKFCIIQKALWQHKLRHRKDV